MKDTSKNIQLDSTLTCPHCGARTTETMPEDVCRYFWECPNCGEIIKPKKGDCCVFCSYGDTACPPVQNEKSCC